MRKYIAGAGAALSALVIAASPPAIASTIIGPQDTTVDWAQEFCLTDCTSTTITSSPISQIDIVMATPGVTFTGVGPVNTFAGDPDLNAITTLGENMSTINFTTPDSADLLVTLNFSPADLTTGFTFYWEQFTSTSQFIATSDPSTSSDEVTWTGSTWNITPMTAPVSVTPLPPAVALFASGLGLLAFIGYRRKRRVELDRKDACQFA